MRAFHIKLAVLGAMLSGVVLVAPFAYAAQEDYTVSNGTGLVLVSGGSIPTVQAFCTSGGSNVGAVVMDAPNYVSVYSAAFGDNGAYFSADSGCATHDFTGPTISGAGLWIGALPLGGATYTVGAATGSMIGAVSDLGSFLASYIPILFVIAFSLTAIGMGVVLLRRYISPHKF